MGLGMIDLGHGGKDSGAVGQGRIEKNDVLLVGMELKRILELNGETIDMTRSTDTFVELNYRVAMEHKKNYDYFVSLHRNSGGGVGVETFCYKFSCTKAKKLATLVHQQIIADGLANANRGVKEGNFCVIRETKTDAILVEMGFIDNAQDNQLFANRYKDYAVAIAKGILAYLGKTYQDSTASKPTPVSDIKWGVVTATRLNVREGRGTNYRVLGTLMNGQKVRLGQLIGDWWSIYYGDHGGFVHKNFINQI